MPQAVIEINGVAGSNENLPIGTLVQLSNLDVGGETMYLWEITDQPEGPDDLLSSTVVENPTFTQRKEGSYRLKLTVNGVPGPGFVDLQIAAVRHLKSNERIPAATETGETSITKGWKTVVNRLLARSDDVVGDANLVVCKLPGAGFAIGGDIVRFSLTGLIKTGLPGEERLMVVETAPATVAANVADTLGVVVNTPTGGVPVANGLVVVRVFGLVEISELGAPTVGDPVYVGDTFQPSLTPGTNSRQIGRVVQSAAGVWRWVIDGSLRAATGGASASPFSPPEKWAKQNVAASLTNSPLQALVSSNFDGIKMLRAGSIVGIGDELSTAVTAGMATVTVTKNGVAVTLSLTHTNAINASGGQATQAVGIDTYVAGDRLGLQITTNGAWAPTPNIEGWIEVIE